MLVGLSAVASVNQLRAINFCVQDIKHHGSKLGAKHISHVACIGVEQPVMESALISVEIRGIEVLVAAISSS